MASIRREMVVEARSGDVWDAIRDVGAVHTRLAGLIDQGMAVMKKTLEGRAAI